jgi:outer membrane receptor protein involved in Fe transport
MMSAIAASGASVPVFAQDQGPSEVITVTGSRIPAPNLESTSPIQVVSSQDIQLGGRTDMSDVLNQLPQVVNNSLGQGLGNRTSGLTTPGGVATVELRGIGPQRTLVLVNGRRLGIGSPYTAIQSPASDIDQIPTYLLDRVEVVTGGASAVYGSDAIAGVVNFILKDDFEGFQVDYHVGQNFYENDSSLARGLVNDFGGTPPSGTSSDGRTQTINVVAGTNFADGNGNVTGYFGYRQMDPVASGDRDFGACQMALADAHTASCIGSGNSNRFAVLGSTSQFAVVGNEFLPWDGSANDRNPPGSFNSQRYIFMQREDERYYAGFTAHVELNEMFTPYAEFGFMNDRTHQEIAPSGLFENSNPTVAGGGYVVNCSNPFLSAQQQATIGCSPAQVAADAAAIAAGGDPSEVRTLKIGRRNVEGGGRVQEYEHTNFRGAGGMRGRLGDAWSYDGYGQYYYVEFFNSNEKYMSFNNINNALLVTGTAADPQCVSGAPCVPYNIFTEGGVTQEAINYLQVTGTGRGSTTLRTIHADLTGDLGAYGIRLPWANDGFGLNFGYEHRNEEIVFAPDAAELSGDLSGFGGASVALDESYSVDELFTEVRVPLIQDKRGVEDLSFNGGYRRSDYSSIGAVDTYKLELQYAPVEDLRFRGSFNHAIRAPSLVELFNPALVGKITFGTDPCAPTVVGGTLVAAVASLQQCMNTGVTAAQYGNGGTTNSIPQGTANQLSQLQGGNVDLDAEEGDSYTLGVTFTPFFIQNFSGSIDYYHIKMEGLVGVFPANVILNNCLNTGDRIFCSQIVREFTTGSLDGASVAGGGYFIQTNQNIAEAVTDGVDLQLNYRLPLSERWGSLAFGLTGSYLLSAETTSAPGVTPYDCVGLFGAICQTVNPRWRHLLRSSWETPWNWTLSLNWRYFGKVALDQNENNATLQFATIGEFNFFNAEIPAYHWVDLAGTWDITDSIQLRAGVNNVLDKNPPIVTSEFTSGGAANTYEIYDAMGRQAFASVTMKF